MVVAEFTQIPFAPRYRISRSGLLQRQNRAAEWVDFRTSMNKAGYAYVSLRVDGRNRSYFVHTLSLTTFVGPRPPGMVARHLDDDPANIYLDNLAWGTRSQNARDAVENRRKRAEHGGLERMGRYSEPYYWEARDGWYSTIRGKRHRLTKGKENKADAFKVFHRLMASEGTLPPDTKLTVALAADLYLDHSLAVHAGSTTEQIRIKLQSFCDMFGGLKLADLRPSHVAKWVAAQEWTATTQRGAITYVKGMVRHAVKERLIASSPIDSVRRPKASRRTKTLTPAERQTIHEGSTDDAFRDYLEALGGTGARPGEVARIEGRHIDWGGGVASLPGKTTKATGKPRVIVLAPAVLALFRRLAERHAEGPLLRNSDGEPWTTNAVRCRFRRMRPRLNLDPKTVAYAYRHSFITDGLERGVSVAAIAELAGHSDLKMVGEVYNHLAERREHLRRAAELAGGAPTSPEP